MKSAMKSRSPKANEMRKTIMLHKLNQQTSINHFRVIPGKIRQQRTNQIYINPLVWAILIMGLAIAFADSSYFDLAYNYLAN